MGAKRRRIERPLTIQQIRVWAEDYRRRYGGWPSTATQPLEAAPGEKWQAIDRALRRGSRGLPGGSSLAQLLADTRLLTVEQILSWADEYRDQHGRWPTQSSGRIGGGRMESWQAINRALREGTRGLPGGSCLARLLAEERGAWHPRYPGPITVEQVLAWADKHHARTGLWPTAASGQLFGIPTIQWSHLDDWLHHGGRGLPGGTSLARVLSTYGRVPQQVRQPLSMGQICLWIKAYRKQTGQWPSLRSGFVCHQSKLKWSDVDRCLRLGKRGLPGGSLLAAVVSQLGGPIVPTTRAPLTVAQILQWADAHYKRTGKWPRGSSGAVSDEPTENWNAIDRLLRAGHRGLPGGFGLRRLLEVERGVPARLRRPPVSLRQA